MAYVYPKLPALKNLNFVRVGGSGLANCLFIYARAIVIAKQYNIPIISPTWFNISIGTYIRKETDKRHYLGLFNSNGEIKGIRKELILSICDHIKESESFNINDNVVINVENLGDFFKPIIPWHKEVSSYILSHIVEKHLLKVNVYDFSNCVAVHVRCGDYIPERRIPTSWYRKQIQEIREAHPNTKILLFSDGKDEELQEIISLPNVERAFFGNAIADIVAISKCKYLIGSDSTFSAWGAYLGQVPCRFMRLKSAPVLIKQENEIVENI